MVVNGLEADKRTKTVDNRLLNPKWRGLIRGHANLNKVLRCLTAKLKVGGLTSYDFTV